VWPIALLVTLLLVGAAQRRRAMQRAAAFRQTGRATLRPVFLRHPDLDRSAWISGWVELSPDGPPVFRASPDIASTEVELPRDRYRIESLHNAPAAMAKPGFAVLCLRSDVGAIELAMPHPDAETLREALTAP
jgi:hypothetical protein